MTEQQKANALAAFAVRAEIAQRNGLDAVARSWRECAANLSVRRAADVVCAVKSFDQPVDHLEMQA